MPSLAIVCALALALAPGIAAQATSREQPRVTLDAGVVEGAYSPTDPAIAVFKGIPFAAPPVGALRWKPPKAPAHWSGVRSAREFAPVCPQTVYDLEFVDRITRRLGGRPPAQQKLVTSEDCLYLSVWSPSLRSNAPLPVIVWVHGGSNVEGWATEGYLSGEPLAREGVVLVMVEYRLGVLGFLADSALTAESPHHSSGNYGLLDQIAALEWVQRNVAAFGGDPSRVTVVGQSAGATNVTCLMLSPLAKGLFHRVIAQSGACAGPTSDLEKSMVGTAKITPAYSSGKYLEKKLGLHRSRDVLHALRALSADSLVSTVADDPEFRSDIIVDGWIIPGQPDLQLARGAVTRVPLLLGSNSDEMRSLMRGFRLQRMAEYPEKLLATLGDDSLLGSLMPRLRAAYPASDMTTAQRRLFEATTDAFGASARYFARGVQRAGEHDVYIYRFTHAIPTADGATLGAFHGAEMPFVFGSDPGWPKAPGDVALGAAIRRYWTQFVRTGNPNSNGLPAWPAYEPATDQSLELGDSVRPLSGARASQFEIQDSAQAIFDARLRAPH